MANVIEAYSRLASSYEAEGNLNSCWGKVTQHALGLLSIRSGNEVVVEVGCGPGIQMACLLEESPITLRFIGVEPADNLRNSAIERTKQFPNAKVLNGKFEELPLESHSVDYLYSLIAFHWVTDLEKAVSELGRVLKEDGGMDIIFSGKHTGKEFTRKITPIFFKHLSPKQMIDATLSQQRLTVEATREAFSPCFGTQNVTISESYHTYYDSLDGHWSWWCRIEGQFSSVPKETKDRCDRAVKEAIATLATENGIPYTIHLLHVKVRR